MFGLRNNVQVLILKELAGTFNSSLLIRAWNRRKIRTRNTPLLLLYTARPGLRALLHRRRKTRQLALLQSILELEDLRLSASERSNNCLRGA